MKLPYIFVVLSLSVLLLAGCSGSGDDSIPSILDRAQSFIQNGEYSKAVDLCDEFTNSPDSAKMSWRDYCEVALIYSIAYDHDFRPEASMAAATRCIDKARSIQPDSTSSFISRLSPQNASAINTVLQTLDAFNTDRSTLGDHEEGDFLSDEETDSHDNVENLHRKNEP